MRVIAWSIAGAMMLVSSLVLSAGVARADDPTATPTPNATPTTYYNFVIPIVQIPIILPTAFELPAKTPIYVNYTPAPNLNPYGLQMDQFALHMVAESINLTQATLDVMGVVGWILDFLIWVWLGGGTLLLISNIVKRGSMFFEAWRYDGGSFKDSWRWAKRSVPMKMGKVTPVKFPKMRKKKGDLF